MLAWLSSADSLVASATSEKLNFAFSLTHLMPSVTWTYWFLINNSSFCRRWWYHWCRWDDNIWWLYHLPLPLSHNDTSQTRWVVSRLVNIYLLDVRISCLFVSVFYVLLAQSLLNYTFLVPLHWLDFTCCQTQFLMGKTIWQSWTRIWASRCRSWVSALWKRWKSPSQQRGTRRTPILQRAKPSPPRKRKRSSAHLHS